MKISRHGDKRVRERIGIPRKAVAKLSSEALAQGRGQNDFKGSFRKYLDWLGREYLTAPLVHNGYIWIFSHDKLVTVYPVPNKFRNHAK